MAVKKGKELDLGGIRLQLDPFILVRRILLRQKLLLTLIAIIGGVITVVSYLNTPKVYATSSQIAIRTDTRDESYFRRLVNRAMRDVRSNEEMMLTINELDLFGSTRASMPYEMALRRIGRELRIDRSTGSVSVSFESKDPLQAQKVVAFVTERVLGTFFELIDSPFRRQIDALQRGIVELEPKVEEARTKLFEFKARHPSIAVNMPDFVARDSPLAGVADDIKNAERGLKRCYAGRAAVAAPPPTRKPKTNGPACRRLKELQTRQKQMLAQFTANHPEVRRLGKEISSQEIACDRESRASGNSADIGGIRPGQSQAQCVEAARAKLAILHREKADIEKKAIRKPRLQRQWRELSVHASNLESNMRALVESRDRAVGERLVAANDFQENFQLVDAPRVPELPVKPDRNAFLAVGMALTALIGLALAAIREALRQTFLGAQEFEEQTGLQVLAVLPDIKD